MTRRNEPQRTCVGCRFRTASSHLLRVVAVEARLVCDPRGRLPGRGAHLHPDPECLALAERRRAFARALRVDGPLDHSAVREQVTGTARTTTSPPAERATTDERSMSQHR